MGVQSTAHVYVIKIRLSLEKPRTTTKSLLFESKAEKDIVTHKCISSSLLLTLINS